MSPVTLFVGVLTASLIIYIRHCFLLSVKQKSAATRLDSYMTHWRGYILDNNFYGLMALAEEWNKREIEILSKYSNLDVAAGHAVRLEAVIKRYVKRQYEKACPEVVPEEFSVRLDLIPDDIRGTLVESISRTQQNIIEGKTYLSDDEAAVLGANNSIDIIRLKSKVINIISNVGTTVAQYYDNPELNPKTDLVVFGKPLVP